jgi:hypothetical protein
VALVAEVDGHLVAVGRYDRLPESSVAEVAFVVADDFQHHGIGSLLLDHVPRAAWRRGITGLMAEVLVGNTAMLRVFFDSRYEVEWDGVQGTVRLRFSIDPAARSAVGAAPNHACGSGSVIWPALFPVVFPVSCVCCVSCGHFGSGISAILPVHWVVWSVEVAGIEPPHQFSHC